MLDRIGQNNQNNEIASQTMGLEKVGSKGTTNPYAKVDKGLLIDETNISDAAIKLYENEQDIKKFTKLAMSDPDDNSADALVLSKALEGGLSIDDDEAIYSIINNEDFLNDLAS